MDRLDDTIQDQLTGNPLQTVGFITVIRCQNSMVVMSTGTTTSKASNVVAGWSSTRRCQQNGFCNVNTWIDATRVVTRNLGAAFEENRKLYLYGYSAGGMLVQAIAAIMRARGYDRPIELCTFGAPKPWLDVSKDPTDECLAMHWQREFDPVPSLPFQTAAGACWRFVTLFNADSEPWRFCRGPGALVLKPTLTSVLLSTTPGTNTQTISHAWNWMTADATQQTNEHAIAKYARELAIVADYYPDPESNRTIGPATAPQRPPLDAANLQQAAQDGNVVLPVPPNQPAIIEIRDQVMQLPAGNTVPILHVEQAPMPFAKTDKRVKADLVKIGAIVQVQWMGHLIALVPSVSKGRTIARAINRFVRTLGNTDSVTGTETQQAVADFLTQAAIPNQGFEPPLNVV